MRIKNKNINCNIQKSECLRIRISLIMLGIICCFLGIQGFTNILNHQIISVSYIKLYSTLMLLGGLISILLGCVIVERVKYMDLTNL